MTRRILATLLHDVADKRSRAALHVFMRALIADVPFVEARRPRLLSRRLMAFARVLLGPRGVVLLLGGR